MVMVVDSTTWKVKWHQLGPWIGQHDPDFRPNGRISIVNNNNDGTESGDILGGSTIVEVDPVKGDLSVTYGDRPGEHWYTRFQGQHQYFPETGTMLITEARAGRVFEVDANRNVVWEFINRYDDKDIADINGAVRYRDDYFTVKDWSCAAPGGGTQH